MIFRSLYSRRDILGQMLRISTILYSLKSLASHSSAAADQQRKLAFAHYMTGQGTRGRNQSIESWKDDIRDAQDVGLDGWQLNFSSFSGRYRDAVGDFVRAGNELGQEAEDFLFFPSFDCNKDRVPKVSEVIDWFDLYYYHPRHFRLNGLPLLSVWQARSVGNDFFKSLKREMEKRGQPISFIPWLACNTTSRCLRNLFEDWTSIDGFFPWVPGRKAPEANLFNRIVQDLCIEYDKVFMCGQGYGLNPLNKMPVFVEKHAAEAITTQMLPLIRGEYSECYLLNVATWNDFGEDHHVTPHEPWGPIGGPHPVHNHRGFSTVLRYYLHWWKTGAQPKLLEDRCIIFHRLQLVAEGSPPFRLSSYQPDRPEDLVYVTSLLKEPAKIRVQSGELPEREIDAPSGLAHWRLPAAAGEQKVTLLRNNKIEWCEKSRQSISSPPENPWSWSLYSETLPLRTSANTPLFN